MEAVKEFEFIPETTGAYALEEYGRGLSAILGSLLFCSIAMPSEARADLDLRD